MTYIENPKTKGSGIFAVIPQQGRCPNNCKHCFFQGHGRSYLKPIEENTPNMLPVEESIGRVIRVNDGNDSNNNKVLVMESTQMYPMKFYNTAIPAINLKGHSNIELFDAPVVLTLNPGKMTDIGWHKLPIIPKNLMFVRIRTNMWNIHDVVIPAVKYYTDREIPVVLTFMAYYDTDDKVPEEIPEVYLHCYEFRKRTLNCYYAITTNAWEMIMSLFKYNHWVYSCSKIEGELGTYKCHRCGNCLREYFYTMEKMRNES